MARFRQRSATAQVTLGILAVGALLIIPACHGGGGGGGDPGQLRINVNPIQFEGLTGLTFDVIRVDAIFTTDLAQEGTVITLSNEQRTLKLIGFSGVTPALFAQFTLTQEGFITQIRFIVEDGLAELGPESLPARIPSGPQTGLKMISADVVIEIKDQATTDVTLALDPTQSVIENRGQGIMVKPVVKALGGAVSAFPINQFLPDRITVLFKDTATEQEITDTINAVSGTIAFRNPYVRYFTLDLPSGSDVRAVQATLNGMASVQSALPDYLVITLHTASITESRPARHIRDGLARSFSQLPSHRAAPLPRTKAATPLFVPNDPDFGLQWWAENTGQFGGTPNVDVDAAQAWDLTTGSTAVVVAVIDSGVDRTHSDLSANIWVNTVEQAGSPGVDDDANGFMDDIFGWNFADNNSNTLDDITAVCPLLPPGSPSPGGHGTAVSGVIGATGNNGVGIAGLNWNVRVMPLRVAASNGCISTSALFNAISYAANNGAMIANISIGGASPSSDAGSLNSQFAAVVGNLLVCTSAGNSTTNVDADKTNFWLFAEINHAQLIAVGAIADTGDIASFSNTGGTSVDLGAPGVNIRTTFRGNAYGYINGTSFSSPITAGVAALVKARFPASTAADMRNRILNNVVTDSRYSGFFVTGGRLNAFLAVQ